jgi:predicted nuclease of predicted toxin-antitoxin system
VRFIIDNALPPRLATLLVTIGHDTVHVRDYGMQEATDEEILMRAIQEDRVIVSADSDFGAILALREETRPSFILFREPDLLSAEDYCRALLPTLPVLESALLRGCVAVFRRGRLRVRDLPLAAE